jgi:hypothetical protein
MHSLLIEHVCYPKNTLSLLDFSAVKVEVCALLVETNAVRKPHSSCDEEVCWLRVRCTQ